MIDLHNPNPLLMTHYELIGFCSGLFAVVLSIALDWWKRRAGK